MYGKHVRCSVWEEGVSANTPWPVGGIVMSLPNQNGSIAAVSNSAIIVRTKCPA